MCFGIGQMRIGDQSGELKCTISRELTDLGGPVSRGLDKWRFLRIGFAEYLGAARCKFVDHGRLSKSALQNVRSSNELAYPPCREGWR
ncbi:unnamed protein product [Cochlearia groenlandica]